MEQTKTPYELCIAEFGGVRELARQVGRDAGSVSKWKKHGTIPTGIQKKSIRKSMGIKFKYYTIRNYFR